MAHCVNKFKGFQVVFALLILLPSVPASAESGAIRRFLNENRIKEAFPYCRQIEELSSRSQEDIAACAWIFFRAKKKDSAEVMMSKLKGTRSTEHQLLTAFSYINNKKYGEAKRLLNTLESRFKGTTIGLTVQELQAELYEAQGRKEVAAFIYKQIVGDDASRARAHWGLARHYLGRNEKQRAREHLSKTARQWPSHIASRYNLGVLYLEQNNHKKAKKWLAEAYKLNRGDSGVLEQLGILFEKKRQIPEAVRFWQRAYDINKKSVLAKNKLTRYYGKLIDDSIQAQRFEKALTYLASVQKIGIRKPRMSLRRGIIYRHLKKYDEAAGEIRAYLSQKPKDSTAHRELGICYVNIKLLNEANASFLKAVRLDPRNGMNHAWLGFVAESRGDLCLARESWRRAIKLLKDPKELTQATRKLASIEGKGPDACRKTKKR